MFFVHKLNLHKITTIAKFYKTQEKLHRLQCLKVKYLTVNEQATIKKKHRLPFHCKFYIFFFLFMNCGLQLMSQNLNLNTSSHY